MIDQHGHLSIAKFPKETDDYSIETWVEIVRNLINSEKAVIVSEARQSFFLISMIYRLPCRYRSSQ